MDGPAFRVDSGDREPVEVRSLCTTRVVHEHDGDLSADRENYERITDDILLDAATAARAQIKQKSLDSLTPHQRVVYNIVRDHGPLGPSEIHDRYTDEVGDSRIKRTVRTYLTKMAQYTLLKAKRTSWNREDSLVDSTAASPVQ